ncbi:MAG TPA: phosphatidate cytidylyltransferase [Sphingobacterium sp.]|jgi:phosphatidate cytidylyltransferase|nr:phosphatidate cytidylyltransferase [Sphingobacterium sp.]
MFWTLFYLIVIFFTIGGIAIFALNRKSNAEQRNARWVKYIFYLLAVSITVWCIQYGIMPYLAIALLIIGAHEIVTGWRSSNKGILFLGLSILFYMAIAFGFHQFSGQVALERVLYVYTIVFTFDGFAQISGQLFGKKKVLPKISPDKTIAGVIGGYVMGLATGLFAMQWLNMSGYAIWFSPLFICTAAFVGDALASWYKRRCNLKDYSKLIPGHGGVLDRFDSLIFAGAVFWLVYL